MINKILFSVLVFLTTNQIYGQYEWSIQQLDTTANALKPNESCYLIHLKLEKPLAYKKAKNVLLHIEQEASDKDIASALRRAAINRPSIEKIILLRGNEKAVVVTRAEMAAKSWLKE